MACSITSGPMPSPPRTAILGVATLISGKVRTCVARASGPCGRIHCTQAFYEFVSTTPLPLKTLSWPAGADFVAFAALGVTGSYRFALPHCQALPLNILQKAHLAIDRPHRRAHFEKEVDSRR